MTEALFDHALLGVALAAIWCAAWRPACAAGAEGLLRLVATAALAATVAVVQALSLGLAGLGTNRWVLTGAALTTLLVAQRSFPAPKRRGVAELAKWWAARSRPARLVAAGLAGAGAFLTVWLLHEAAIGFDASIYHYPEVLAWVHDGRPGGVARLGYDLPFGNYPRTNEVLGAWLAGIGRSFVPLGLWPVACATVLGAATWAGLRELRAPPLASALAVVAVLTTLWNVRQLSEPLTDLPALSWLAAAGAMLAASARKPSLTPFAVLAAGLAIGTKTTVAIPLAGLLAAGWWLHRGRVGPRAPLVAAAALAAVTGATWYVVNLISHGSPLWPFMTLPWGSEAPRFLDLIAVSPIDTPRGTLRTYRHEYGGFLAGMPVLLALAPVAAIAARSRLALGVAGMSVLALVVFALGPIGGLPESREVAAKALFPISTLRYLLPAVLAAAVALALAARGEGVARALSLAALGVAAAWNLIACIGLGAPFLPPAWQLLLAGALGAAAALVQVPSWERSSRFALPALCIAAVTASGLAAPGYPERSARADSSAFGRGVVIPAEAAGEAYPEDLPIAFATRLPVAALAGSRLEHPLLVLPPHDCRAARRAAAEGWVVVSDPSLLEGVVGVAPYSAGRCLRGTPVVFTIGGYRVVSSAPRTR